MLALALTRFVRRSGWSTGMAVAGIALAVMSVVSVHLVTARIAEQLEALIPGEFAGLTHYLHRDRLSADNYFNLRKDWRGGQHPSVEFLTPVIDEPVVLDGQSLRLLGLDLVGGGFGMVDLPSGNFDLNGVWVESSVQPEQPVQPGQPQLGAVRVNGVIEAPPGTVVADIGVAQQLLGWTPQQLSYVAVRIEDPLRAVKDYGERLLPGLGAGWPEAAPRIQLDNRWQVLSAQQQHPTTQFGKSVLFNLSALAMLGVLVAWFLIYQVAVAWLRRLWPTMERFYLLGVDMSALVAGFVLTLLLVGVLAATLGLMLGVWLAEWLFSAATGVADISFSLDGWVLLKGFGSAVLVAVGGGLWAVWKRTDTEPRRGVSTWLFAAVLVGLAVWGVTAAETGLAGAFMSIATLSLISMLLIRPWLDWSRRRAGWLRGPILWVLGVRETLWHPGDLTVAVGGLSLAVATAIGVGVMVDSFRADFSRFLQQRLAYEITVQGPGEVLEQLAAAVEGVQLYREGEIRVNGVPAELRVSNLHPFEAARYGYAGQLPPDAALISEQLARTRGAGLHDVLMVEGVETRIAGVFPGFGDMAPRLVVDRRHPAAPVAAAVVSGALRELGADDQAALAARFPQLRWQKQSALKQQALETFDQTFVITGVLITIALLVAGIGMYVATTSLRLNRRASARMLASMGISRWENLAIDLSRAGGTAGVALGISLPLGILFGWILCQVVNPRAFGWTVELALMPGALLEPLGWGAAAALVAGVVRVGADEEAAHAN